MKKSILFCVAFLVLVSTLYFFGRLYYYLTDGFEVANITSDFSFHSEWETRPLNRYEETILYSALNQSYSYLGKGCQAYVFESQDQQFVIKFFKYQRYKLQPWLKWLPSVPFIDRFREEKLAKKQQKLERFLLSWKVAFDHLQNEASLIYVHLNKTDHLNRQIEFVDKIGKKYRLQMDQMEFCVQRKAIMLDKTLLAYIDNGNLSAAKKLIDEVIDLLLSGYYRGYADNDPALMQNTGVVDGRPIHIDIGQLVEDVQFKNPAVFQLYFLMKMQELKRWLLIHSPELLN